MSRCGWQLPMTWVLICFCLGCQAMPPAQAPGGERTLPTAGVPPPEPIAPTGVTYDLANCAAATGTSLVEDRPVDNQTLCYQARAAQLGDGQSCLHLPDAPTFVPARCLEGVSRQTARYWCDQHPNSAVIEQCNQLLMTNWGTDPALHELAGLAPYRVDHQLELVHGADFTVQGQPPTITAEGLVSLPDYEPAASHLCHPQEAEPIPVGTGLHGAYLYITSCVVTPTTLILHYFRYALPGVVFPDPW